MAAYAGLIALGVLPGLIRDEEINLFFREAVHKNRL